MRILSRIATLIITMTGAAQAHAGWTRTFTEEFDGPTLDQTKWQKFDYWSLRLSLFEKDRQCYVDQNVSVANGKVSLTATNDVPVDCNPDPGNLLYSSGEISTGSSFNQAFGYFEVRMRAPKGAGLASQFRLATPGGAFPPTPPEFVPAEILGSDPTRVNQRYTSIDAQDQPVDLGRSAPVDADGDFHVYGMDWSPGKVIYYVDGKETSRTENPNLYSQPLYLVLNLSVGSVRGGAVDAASLPGSLDVDYVHVYARNNDGTDDAVPPGVKPPAPVDQVAPVVKVTAPSKITFGSTVSLSAQATDNVGVTGVTFLVDGKPVCTVARAPFTCKVKFDEAVVTKASVTITAQATDAAGNLGKASATSQIQVPILLVLISLAKAILKALFG